MVVSLQGVFNWLVSSSNDTIVALQGVFNYWLVEIEIRL